MTPLPIPLEGEDPDAWQDRSPGEWPALPAFDDEEISAVLWRRQMEHTL